MNKVELWITVAGLVKDIEELLKCRNQAFSKTYNGIQPDATKPALVPEQLIDNLENMRMRMQYIVFDLEATRRENNSLRKLLEGK